MIRFLHQHKLVTLEQQRADLTVLNFLREQQNVTSAKEGCGSGDCGACTVVVASVSASGDKLEYKAINSCITFMSALNGKQLITADELASQNTLHPVQQAMVDNHGSQCGFCTPGFVMSMFALFHQNQTVDRKTVLHALSGNLCRCTGYQPIINATLEACKGEAEDTFTQQELATIKRLTALQIDNHSNHNLFMPTNREQLADFRQRYPQAILLAGSTDLALEYTQQLEPLDSMISLSNVLELKQIKCENNILSIGAACTLSECEPALLAHFPALTELIERFASLPIRNQATIGGNIANASPIGDLAPAMLALEAVFVCDNGTDYRKIPAKEFFLAYKQTQLAENEWLASIEIPFLTNNTHLRAYKVSKRVEDDISAVCAVFKIGTDKGRITHVNTGFGGVAATPISCENLHAALCGKVWSDANSVSAGKDVLSKAFTPLDDVRASAEYRQQIVANLWHRFWLETNAQSNAIVTRVLDHA